MKTALLALVCLGAGAAIGLGLTRREFSRDVLPLGVSGLPHF